MPETSDTLVQLLRRRAETLGSATALTFVSDGGAADQALTFAELDERARAIAGSLRGRAEEGSRALLVYAPGPDLVTGFFGALYAGLVPVPVYPPDPMRLNRSLPRFQAVIEDAHPSLVLTTALIEEMSEQLKAFIPQLGAGAWCATDTVPVSAGADWQEPKLTPRSLAFLQYTSGSTSTPKGVQLSHANLLHNSALIHRYFRHGEQSRAVIWLPPYHDMGLIGGILQPLYGAFPVALLSPLEFLQRPALWLETVSRFRATSSGGPNFAFDLCVRKTTPEARAALDLSSWSLAFCGAEPLRAETLKGFCEAFGPSGFQPKAMFACYGLAEATLFVCGGPAGGGLVEQRVSKEALERGEFLPTEEAAGQTMVASGLLVEEMRVEIVEPLTRERCGPGKIGEIWVAGPSVAEGYWHASDDAKQVFEARLYGDERTSFLRTGDLGIIREGQLWVTGRLTDVRELG